MNRLDTPANSLFINQVILRLMSIMLLIGLAACAATPQATTRTTTSNINVVSAYDMYNMSNYSGAVSEFDSIIGDGAASANSRRMAHLGKALIYLGADPHWYSIDNAKLSLNSAGVIAPDGDAEFAVETDMLMDAILNLMGTESELAGLKSRSARSRDEIAALKMERDSLLTEQKTLNEALEKLKDLTLSN